MIRHSHRTWHLDKIAHSVAGSEALRGWLPVIGAEIMLLVTFLLWLLKSGDEYHGVAMVYAWTTYGLIALALLFYWTGQAEKESARDHR